MASVVAFIREDGQGAMPIPGVTEFSVTYPARVTEFPIPDRTHISDGVVLYPRRCSIRAKVSPRLVGAWTQQDVEQYLEAVQAGAVLLDVQQPTSGLLPAMLVETYRAVADGTEGFILSVELKGAVFASTSYIQVSQVRGEPPESVRGAVQDAAPTGSGTATEVDSVPTAAADISLLSALGL